MPQILVLSLSMWFYVGTAQASASSLLQALERNSRYVPIILSGDADKNDSASHLLAYDFKSLHEFMDRYPTQGIPYLAMELIYWHFSVAADHVMSVRYVNPQGQPNEDYMAHRDQNERNFWRIMDSVLDESENHFIRSAFPRVIQRFHPVRPGLRKFLIRYLIRELKIDRAELAVKLKTTEAKLISVFTRETSAEDYQNDARSAGTILALAHYFEVPDGLQSCIGSLSIP